MSRLRHRAGTLAAVAGLLIGACADAPAPPPEPVPHYRMAADHCARLDPEAIAATAGLVVPDDAENSDRQDNTRTYDEASCWVEFEAPDDRFSYVPYIRFRAYGRAGAKVFAEPGVAEDRYRVLRGNYERLADADPGLLELAASPAEGWWDEGMILHGTNRGEDVPDHEADLDPAHVSVTRGVRHHNLLLEVDLSAWAPVADLGEVERLLTDLTREFADQVRAALELTTVTVTPTPPA